MAEVNVFMGASMSSLVVDAVWVSVITGLGMQSLVSLKSSNIAVVEVLIWMP